MTTPAVLLSVSNHIDNTGGITEIIASTTEMWIKIVPMSMFQNTDLYNKKASAYIITRYDTAISDGMYIKTADTTYAIIRTFNINSQYTLITATEARNHV